MKTTQDTPEVLCLGMMVCDILAAPVDEGVFTRDTTRAQSVTMSSGGDAMTQSIICARLGRRTGLMAKVGADRFGEYLLRVLDENGVDRRGVGGDAPADPAVSLVLVRADGGRHFIASPGLNNATLSLPDLDMDALCAARVIGYGSLLFMRALDPAVGREVFRPARARGARVVADCCANVYGVPARTVLDALPDIDYFAPSREEAAALTSRDDPARMARDLLDCGCGHVLIKLGAEGCYLRDRDQEALLPALPVERVADTTGAGDNFVGGLLAALAEGWPLVEAARFAQATAALSIQRMGAVGAVRSREQVLASCPGLGPGREPI